MSGDAGFVVGFARCNESALIIGETLDAIERGTRKPERIIIVDNGDAPATDVYGALLSGRNTSITRPGRNIGCAGGWNLIHVIAMEIDPALRVITLNADCAPAPDTFERMLEIPAPAIMLGFGFGCFIVDGEIRRQLGGFDETFYPAYFEDGDYRRRANLAGIPVHEWPIEYVERLALGRDRTSRGIVHGSYDADGYQGWRGERLAWFWECYEKNRQYYIAKWGGDPGSETFSVPFNGARDKATGATP